MIRQMKWEDIEEAAELFQKVYAAAPWYDTWEIEQAKRYLSELMGCPLSEGYVYIHEGAIGGVCLGNYQTWYDGTHFILKEFFVSSRLHGIGIGSQIIEFLKNHWAARRVVQLELWTGKGYPAQNFYEKHGFDLQKDVAVMQCLLKKTHK